MAADDPTGDLPYLPAAGDVLAGKYRVERVLGSGAMGVVVAAVHVELDQRVAVKFLLPEAVASQEAAMRFAREARAAVRIKSEHVARVLDVGRLESGAPFIVMEYLEGRDLAQRVREGPIPIEDAVDYVIQAADAMAEAHSIGIVHRDLKPANLFLSERADGSHVVKVLDFGISKVSTLDIADAALTRTSTAMGSPLYMSPEQMRSAKDVDARTDIWALGTILFELLAGVMPFRALTYPELCAKILAEPPEALRELRPEIPEGLDAIVRRCLEKNREHRYANVAELAHALVPFAPKRSRQTIERIGRVLSRAGISSSNLELPVSLAVPLTPAATTPEAGTNTSWAETAPSAPKRSRAILVAGGVVVVAGIGLAALAVLASRAEPEAASPAPLDTAPETPALAASPPGPAAVESAPSAPLEAAPPAPSVTPAPNRPSAPKPVAAKPKPTATTTAKPPPPAPAPAPSPKPSKNPLDIGLK